ncbi:TOBE domain-containing protein, partial [Nocardia araoensis]|uniref:TOBE domain-containing protein n=1 Tax=Nocardia araoensis TaxID=228600 RepID=UPI00058436C6
IASENEAEAGRVRAVDFRGADVILTIELDGTATPILVRRASVAAPVTGQRVRLEVIGSAVAYAEPNEAA